VGLGGLGGVRMQGRRYGVCRSMGIGFMYYVVANALRGLRVEYQVVKPT
jgi:hypothetical protein